MALPAFMVKADPPAPSALAARVTGPAALRAPERLTAFWPITRMLPVVVRFRTVISPGVPPARVPTWSVMSWLPALRVVPAAMMMSPAPAVRLARMAPGSFAVTEIAPLFVLTLLLIKTSRPACRVRVTPAFVMAMGSVTVRSVFACSVALVARALMLAGVMVVVPAALLAKRLFTPSL